MGLFGVLILAIGLSMDAFAVSIANGIRIKNVKLLHMLKFGFFFGFAQFLMPLIGWFLASRFSHYIHSFDHWIAFVLLGHIGGKMIVEAIRNKDCEVEGITDTSFRSMTVLAIATSIDAMAAGVAFSIEYQKLNEILYVLFPCIIIGITTFLFSFFGILLGNRIGCVLKRGAEILGGIILVSIGLKILIEHIFL